MRALLRRLILWALAPTDEERQRLGLLPGETTQDWLRRRQLDARLVLPALSQKVEGQHGP